MDLFELNRKIELEKSAPLADRLRPKSLDAYIGQDHLVGEGKIIRRMIKADRIYSCIFYGPPGVGKTTLAKIISNSTNMAFEEVSAVASGISDLKEKIQIAKDNLAYENKKTILFVDEIHRFNKSQQDYLLPFVEDATIILIGATTENPYFEVNKALLSRAQVLTFERFTEDELRDLLSRAINSFDNLDIEISDEAINYIVMTSNGDARTLLNSFELAVLSSEVNNDKVTLDLEIVKNTVLRKTAIYDKGADEHYDTISAFIKSMRGSDPDASVYYLAKMLDAGEDIKFIARRIMIFASEDIGLADPNAMNIANSCFQSINVVGMPESRIILSNAVIYMALAPKSNSAYMAINEAMDFVKNNKHFEVPKHLRDSHYSGAKSLEYGIGYKYPHSYKFAYTKQNYLPDEIIDKKFYNKKEIGYEKSINERLEKIKEINNGD